MRALVSQVRAPISVSNTHRPTASEPPTAIAHAARRALELISHVRGSTRSGSSGKRRWDEVVSLLAEAAEAGVEFDELQQLGAYEANCNAWRVKAESAVKACGWLSVICSSWSDDDDGDDNVNSENEAQEGGDDGDACDSLSHHEMSTGDDKVEGPSVVDVKEIFKSSWWNTEDIQVRPPFATKPRENPARLTSACAGLAFLSLCRGGRGHRTQHRYAAATRRCTSIVRTPLY